MRKKIRTAKRLTTRRLMLKRESNKKRIETKKLKKPGLRDSRPKLRKKMMRTTIRLEKNANRLRKHQLLLERILRQRMLERSKSYQKRHLFRPKNKLRQRRRSRSKR